MEATCIEVPQMGWAVEKEEAEVKGELCEEQAHGEKLKKCLVIPHAFLHFVPRVLVLQLLVITLKVSLARLSVLCQAKHLIVDHKVDYIVADNGNQDPDLPSISHVCHVKL